jgi:hypothetical protein
VVEAAIVWRGMVGVEEYALLHWQRYQQGFKFNWSLGDCIHRLKLVTGVDTSTRPASRPGRAGTKVKSSSRRAAAVAKRSAFCVSTGMLEGGVGQHEQTRTRTRRIDRIKPCP